MATNTNVIKFQPKARRQGGFTAVPHDLLEVVASGKFKGQQARVLLAVARLTLGWQQERAVLTLGRIAEVTNMKATHIAKALRELEAMGAIEVAYTKAGRIIGIIDDYANWADQNGHSKTVTSDQSGHSKVTNLVTDPLDKESIKHTKNPPVVPQTPEEALTGHADADASAPLAPSSVKRKKLQTLDEYAAACKAAGVKLIPETDPVFAFADRVGIPRDWLYLCWREFARRNREQGKRQRDWPQTFRNCVRSNWYGLWKVARDGSVFLTSEGELIRREVEAQEEAE